MNDEAKNFMICISWISGIVLVFIMACYCVFHECPKTVKCDNPACCKPAEAPTK